MLLIEIDGIEILGIEIDGAATEGIETEGRVMEAPPKLTLAAMEAGSLGMTSVVMGMLMEEIPAFWRCTGSQSGTYKQCCRSCDPLLEVCRCLLMRSLAVL